MSRTSNTSRKNKPSTATKASPVVLDFLVETYLVSQEIGRVSLRAIADRLDVSAPAVSRMAQRLVRRAYVRREGACGLALTETGELLALRAIRKRRIFEVFLVKAMGYSWHEVYPMAAASSNHLGDELVERMFEKLDHPDRCAHGDPIPTREGKLDTPAAKPLSDLPTGASGQVGRIASHDGDMLRYLNSLNLKPGAQIELVAHAPFSGPIRVRVQNGSFKDEHVIGAELAAKIFVE